MSSRIERVTVPFADLYCTFTHGGTSEHRPVYGHAVIAYDGRGRWWVDGITTHSRWAGHPDHELVPGGALWRQIAVGLERHRGEAVADAINAALDGGAHMALFDEHRPVEGARNGPPPHVSFNLRRADLAGAAGHVAAIAGLVVMLAGILAAGTVATAPWPGHQAAAHAAHGLAPAVFAQLDGGCP